MSGRIGVCYPSSSSFFLLSTLYFYSTVYSKIHLNLPKKVPEHSFHLLPSDTPSTGYLLGDWDVESFEEPLYSTIRVSAQFHWLLLIKHVCPLSHNFPLTKTRKCTRNFTDKYLTLQFKDLISIKIIDQLLGHPEGVVRILRCASFGRFYDPPSPLLTLA